MSQLGLLKKCLKDIMLADGMRLENIRFNVGERVVSPGSSGCYEKNGQWYLYEFGDRCEEYVNGPFSLEGCIKAISVKFGLSYSKTNKLNSTEEEIFVNSNRIK